MIMTTKNFKGGTGDILVRSVDRDQLTLVARENGYNSMAAYARSLIEAALIAHSVKRNVK